MRSSVTGLVNFGWTSMSSASASRDVLADSSSDFIASTAFLIKIVNIPWNLKIKDSSLIEERNIAVVF